MIRGVVALCILTAAGVVYASACSSKQEGDAAPSDASSAAPPPSTATAADAGDLDAGDGAADAGDGAGDAASDASVLPGKTEGCPPNMVLVEGDYCPEVLQKCLEHHEEFKKDEARKKKKRDAGEAVGKSTVSERCLKYEAPSVCLSKERRPMRFCIDRYEWPNEVGEKPMFLISWVDAKKECEKIGKRLCTEAEFNFACEGEDMLPYTYGYERDPQKCSIDRPYRKREKKLFKYARCMKDPVCKAEIERLDQRLPVGSMPACVSPFGAFDLNGNINEWVEIPKKEPPNRSGLKGGWWGPVRGRCRPTVDFHKEEDYGYEEGFRCCANAR
ncbi:MAG: SUMF1/EgtB/PvdO family nonheme iron enzyme [Polyangiaceae bacterium]|nr:SUMF1/EgtB/PvdO family nonheme iron enzyme [Polyangiaceae bacterium]